jgi:hypothetical protein
LIYSVTGDLDFAGLVSCLTSSSSLCSYFFGLAFGFTSFFGLAAFFAGFG